MIKLLFVFFLVLNMSQVYAGPQGFLNPLGGSTNSLFKWIADEATPYPYTNTKSLLFDGDEYVEATDSASLNFTTAFSISIWVKTGASGTTMRIASSAGVTTEYQWILTQLSTGKIVLHLSPEGTSLASYVDDVDSAIDDGAWHHICNSWDAAAGAFLVVDGVSKAVTLSYCPVLGLLESQITATLPLLHSTPSATLPVPDIPLISSLRSK